MSRGLICYLRIWHHLFTATCWSIAGLPRLWRRCLGCPMGHCPKKKSQNIKKSKIQKSKNLRSIVVQSRDPSFVLGEPHFVLFCFHLLFLSIPEVQPFVGGHPFCVVWFSFVVRCPVPWSSVVVVIPYFVLFFCRFIGDHPWSSFWFSNKQHYLSWGRLVRNLTYQFISGKEKKYKLPCFALLIPWRSIAHLGAWVGKKGENSSG